MSNPSKNRGGMGRGLGALGLGSPPPAPSSLPALPSTPTRLDLKGTTREPNISQGNGTEPETKISPATATTSEKESSEALKPLEKATEVITKLPPLPNNSAREATDPTADLRKVGLVKVGITSIAPNPYQPRKHINPEILEELAQSIRENGLIQPPVVSLNPLYNPDYKEPTDLDADMSLPRQEYKARYLLIAGERRWQASKLAGLTEIPVVVKEATPLQMLELALVENIQRADLNPLEEAQAFKQLMQEFKLTQEAVAQRVGKSRSSVANVLRLLDLPPEILATLDSNLISEGHARALLMVQRRPDQMRLHHDVIARDYSVRQTEEMARRLNATALAAMGGLPPTEDKKLSPAEKETRKLEEEFSHSLGLQVTLNRSSKGGKLIISYTDDGQLDQIYDKIVGTEI